MSLLSKIRDKVRFRGAQLSYVTGQLKNYQYCTRRNYFEDKILHCKEMGVTDTKYCEHEIIVSLTTFGKRLQEVCYTIESLMQQTMPANRIILNLDPETLKQPIPLSLIKQTQRGLEIVRLEEDIRSYKKLIPTLEANPNAIIITVDDDVLYNFDVIERLFNSYKQNPGSISALRLHTITLDDNGLPLPYEKWGFEKSDTQNSNLLFFTGCGGVLYPPKCLSPEVLDKEAFTTICPTADDVWFNAMALCNGTNVVKAPSRSGNGCDYIINEDVQDIGLCQINTGEGGRNDVQIKAVFEKYGIYDILSSGH